MTQSRARAIGLVVRRVAVAGQQHAHQRGVVHVRVVIVGVLERPPAGRHVRPAHRPVALHVEDLPCRQPVAGCLDRRAPAGVVQVAAVACFGHRHAGQAGVPDRRDAGLHVGALAVVDDQLADRQPGQRRVRVGRLVAEGGEHHHAVGHGGVDGAQPVLAVQPLGDEGHRLLDGAGPHLGGEEAPAALECDVQRLERVAPVAAIRSADVVADALGRPGEQLADVHAARVGGARLQRHQHQQRHDHRARPVGHLGEVEEEPLRQQHDLHWHGGDGAPGHLAKQGKLDAGEHVGSLGAAGGQDRCPRARHVRCLRAVAEALKREVGLHAGGKVEGAIVEQRPAAVRALYLQQIHADARLQGRIDPVEIVLEQDVLGRDGGVGFQLETPVTVRVLPPAQRVRRTLDAGLQSFVMQSGRSVGCGRFGQCLAMHTHS